MNESINLNKNVDLFLVIVQYIHTYRSLLPLAAEQKKIFPSIYKYTEACDSVR